jgi:uncharacterized protein
MVKPTGSICNLDCTYWYYLHKKELLGSTNKFRISDEILETHIRQYIEGQDRSEVVFSWQGGEPTLLGIEFFQKVIALEQKYKKPGQRIENDLQTNGTLLNDDWGAFLKKHNFLVGLSIDGPEELHDRYRVAKDGAPTFRKVFAAAEMLHRHGVPINTLTVVNRENVKRPLQVYKFLRNEVRPRQMQFIPCVEPIVFRDTAPEKWDPDSLPLQDSSAARPGTPDSVVTDWSVDPEDWGNFLCKVWDCWYQRDIGNVFVNHFENAVSMWMGKARRCVSITSSAVRKWRWSTTGISTSAATTCIPSTNSGTFWKSRFRAWCSLNSSASSGLTSPARCHGSVVNAGFCSRATANAPRIALFALTTVSPDSTTCAMGCRSSGPR